MFFPEVDAIKTKVNVKRKLKEYVRWREVANDNIEQNITQVLTFMPRSNNNQPNRPIEKLAISKVDAELELEAIEGAVSRIFSPEYRKILIDKYLLTYPKSNDEISEELGYERTRYFEKVDSALLAFANQYRQGSLLVFVESGQLED